MGVDLESRAKSIFVRTSRAFATTFILETSHVEVEMFMRCKIESQGILCADVHGMTKVICLVGTGVPMTFSKREFAKLLFLLILGCWSFFVETPSREPLQTSVIARFPSGYFKLIEHYLC